MSSSMTIKDLKDVNKSLNKNTEKGPRLDNTLDASTIKEKVIHSFVFFCHSKIRLSNVSLSGRVQTTRITLPE